MVRGRRDLSGLEMPVDLTAILVHAIPEWYGNLIPVPAGTPDPLPPWSVQSHLAFMAANGKTLRIWLKTLFLNLWV